MEEHPEVLAVLLLTMFVLVDQSTELATIFKDKRGPEILSDTWKVWEQDEDVMTSLLHCLTAFVGDADVMPRLMTLKYVERTAKTFEIFAESSSVLRESMTALARMAANEKPRKKMLQEGVVGLAIQAMERFPKQKRLLVAGALVLDAVFCGGFVSSWRKR